MKNGFHKNSKKYQKAIHYGGFTLFFNTLLILSVFATPPASKYFPGETLNPNCSPTDINCTVEGFSDSQNLSLSGSTLSIDRGNYIDFSSLFTANDKQNLSLSGSTLSIDRGNYIDFSSLFTANDKQNLSLSGSTLSIDRGNYIDFSSLFTANDKQNLSLSGGILSIQNGNSITLPNGGIIGQTSGIISNPTSLGTTETWVGENAGGSGASTNKTVLIGYNAGAGSAGFSYTAVGENAGQDSTGIAGSNFFGLNTGRDTINAWSDNFFGAGAGRYTQNVQQSNFFGDSAGESSNANNANFFGSSAGSQATNAGNSNFFGTSAGQQASEATNSNFFGSYAGQNSTNASYSNFFGLSAGAQATNATNSNFFGPHAGENATDASSSIFLGVNAGNSASKASNSIFIGSYAGNGDKVDNTSGGNSILIGDNTSTAGFSNSIALGKGATNTASNEFMIGSNGGILYDVVNPAYTNTRDDSGISTPINFLYTNTSGKILSAPLGMTTSGLNFQAITDNGNTTSNSIQIGDSLYIKHSASGFAGNINVGANGLSANREYDLPDNSGNLTLSVNGIPADGNGNISLAGTYKYYAESTDAPKTNPTASSIGAIALGDGVNANGNYALGIGTNLNINADNSGIFGGNSLIQSINSYAIGYNNTIQGISQNGFIFGTENTIDTYDDQAYIFGDKNSIGGGGKYTMTLGHGNTVNAGDENIILGNNNTTSGVQQAFIFGEGINNKVSQSIDIGTQDATKFTIDSSGRATLRGALSFNGTDGNVGDILISNGAATLPSWTAPSSLIVGAANGLTKTGGNIELGGTLSHATTITQGTNKLSFDTTGMTTQTAMMLGTNTLTTGTALDIYHNGGNLNSTNGLLYVRNGSATTLGTLARFQSNTSTGAGMTILANGNIGIGNISPNNRLEITAATTNASGLRFTNLTSASTAGASSGKALSVNASGDIVLENVPAGGANTSLSSISSGSTINSIDSTNFAQTWNWSTANTQNPFTLTANALTTGTLFSLSSSNTATTGNIFSIGSASTSTFANGGVRINMSGDHGGNAFQIDDITTTGNAMKINVNSLTTGIGLSLSHGGTSLGSNGEIERIDMGGNVTGSALNIVNSSGIYTGGGLFKITASAATTGDLQSITASALTSGTALNITRSGAGFTGILERLNMGAATGGNGLNISTSGIYTGGGLLQVLGDSATSGTLGMIRGNGLTSGTLLALTSTSTATTGDIFNVTSASTSAFTNGGVRFNFSGGHTGNGFQIDDSTTTGTAFKINANALTTGSAFNITSSYAAGNSTNGLLYVANTSAVTNGTIVRIQANSTAGAGLTGLANGNIGIGTITPKSTFEVNGIIATGVQTVSAASTAITKSYVSLSSGDAILPRAQDNPGAIIFLRNVNNSGTINVTIAAGGGQFFDASATAGFATYGMTGNTTGKSIMVVSDGSNWTVFRPAN